MNSDQGVAKAGCAEAGFGSGCTVECEADRSSGAAPAFDDEGSRFLKIE